MKNALFTVAILFAVGSASGQEAIHREVRASSGQKLTLDLSAGGGVRITGWDRDLVSVDGLLKGRDARDCRVEAAATSSGVEVTAHYVGRRRDGNSSNLEFEIRVPRRFDVELKSMGGDFSMTDVEGRTTGQTMGGDLNLLRIKGELNLTTMGGDIRLGHSEVNGSVKTMGGDVTIEHVVGDVKGSSMGGDVVYRNVRTDVRRSVSRAVEEEVRISTMGGEIMVEDASSGANVSTMGGDIRIRRAARYVRAKTMGGDIHIDSVDGWVQASTMGGDVSVTMVGNPEVGERHVEIESKGGEIELTLPEGSSIRFDIRLAYTRNSKQNFKITSDFPISLRETDQWEYTRGDPRKFIYGTGSVGSGKNLVKIETINGDITVRKGR